MFNFKLYWQKISTIRLKNLFECGVKLAKAETKSPLMIPMLLIKMSSYFKKYGCIPYEYLNYRLFEMNKDQLNSCYFALHNVNFIENINDLSNVHILRDKRILLQRLGSNLGRDFLDLENSTLESFKDFIKKHTKFIVKPNSLAAGKDIEVYDYLKSEFDISALRNSLLKKNVTLVEEFITQHNDLNKIFDKTVNTLRIHTLKIEDTIEIILNMEMRFGSGEAVTNFDNGITVHIDNETGKIVGDGYSSTMVYKAHPDSHIIFHETKIPFFKEAKELALNVAALVPEVNYIGWDIAISPQGPVIVEGNGASAAYSFEQIKLLKETGFGIKNQYDEVLDYYKRRIALDEDKVNKINNLLFTTCTSREEYDVLIILGSSCCEYRATKALEIMQKNPTTMAIVSGGNHCMDNNQLKEADFMYDYLIKKGIEKDRIIIENSSRNTKENLIYSISCVENHFKETATSIGIVSAGFHMRRILNLLESMQPSNKIKFSLIPAYGDNTGIDNWYKNKIGINIISKEIAKLGYNFFDI